MTPERLEYIAGMADGPIWNCDNGLCDYVVELIDAMRVAHADVARLIEERDEAWKQLEYKHHHIVALVKDRDETRAALEQVSSDDRMSESQITAAITEAQKERDEARAEVERLKAERDEAHKWLEGICSEFEGAVAHADWRAAGSKGMSVPFTGDFASVTQLPGAINKMRWWVKGFRAALNKEVPNASESR